MESESPRQINAVRLVRKMRGGAQSHLLECDDGRFWVVKFLNNPQHRRILVNERIASAVLIQLRVSSPETAIISIDAQFLARNPRVCIMISSGRREVESGRHFGSAYPGNPNQLSVYDFLPDVLFEQVENARHFLGALAFDKWTGNADARQAIFFRTKPRAAEDPTHYVAQMMDHGYVFDGPRWTFPDSPLQGLYFRPLVYRLARSFDDFQPWLDQIMHFPKDILDCAVARVPPQWLVGDHEYLDVLIAKLLRRRERVPDLISSCSQDPRSPFPCWQC